MVDQSNVFCGFFATIYQNVKVIEVKQDTIT